MTPKPKFDYLLEAAVKSWGAATGAFGLIASIFSYFIIGGATKYEARIVIPCAMVVTYLVTVAFRAFCDAHSNSFIELPKVHIASRPSGAFKDTLAILLAAPSPLFAHDSLVSIYMVESEMERLIGIGKVVNIQVDKKIQIAVIADVDYGEAWKSLYDTRLGDLSKIVLRPSIPNFVLEELSNG